MYGRDALAALGQERPLGIASCVPVRYIGRMSHLVGQREVAERRLEVGHHAGLAARALGEDEQDVAVADHLAASRSDSRSEPWRSIGTRLVKFSK